MSSHQSQRPCCIDAKMNWDYMGQSEEHRARHLLHREQNPNQAYIKSEAEYPGPR